MDSIENLIKKSIDSEGGVPEAIIARETLNNSAESNFGDYLSKLTETLGNDEAGSNVRKEAALEIIRSIGSPHPLLINVFKQKWKKVHPDAQGRIISKLQSLDENTLVVPVQSCLTSIALLEPAKTCRSYLNEILVLAKNDDVSIRKAAFEAMKNIAEQIEQKMDIDMDGWILAFEVELGAGSNQSTKTAVEAMSAFVKLCKDSLEESQANRISEMVSPLIVPTQEIGIISSVFDCIANLLLSQVHLKTGNILPAKVFSAVKKVMLSLDEDLCIKAVEFISIIFSVHSGKTNRKNQFKGKWKLLYSDTLYYSFQRLLNNNPKMPNAAEKVAEFLPNLISFIKDN